MTDIFTFLSICQNVLFLCPPLSSSCPSPCSRLSFSPSTHTHTHTHTQLQVHYTDCETSHASHLSMSLRRCGRETIYCCTFTFTTSKVLCVSFLSLSLSPTFLFFFSLSASTSYPLSLYFSSQVIRDVLLLGHRQAFAWVDEWIGMLKSMSKSISTSKINCLWTSPECMMCLQVFTSMCSGTWTPF